MAGLILGNGLSLSTGLWLDQTGLWSGAPGLANGAGGNGPGPSATPLQYITPGANGVPIYINESSTANLQYIAPTVFINEAS